MVPVSLLNTPPVLFTTPPFEIVSEPFGLTASPAELFHCEPAPVTRTLPDDPALAAIVPPPLLTCPPL
jgi:hypothetical protein